MRMYVPNCQVCPQVQEGRLPGWRRFSRGQPYNVVLAHSVADFDSLAAAVGVAKLWNLEDPSVGSSRTYGSILSCTLHVFF